MEVSEDIFEYIRVTQGKVNREVVDLESLNFAMKILKEVRSKESDMDHDIAWSWTWTWTWTMDTLYPCLNDNVRVRVYMCCLA